MVFSVCNGNSGIGQSEGSGNKDMILILYGIEHPHTINAAQHGFLEIVTFALPLNLCGGQTCVNMADFPAKKRGIPTLLYVAGA